MKFTTALNIAVGVCAAIAFASIAPPAFADDNPYHPAPIAVSETPDHGQGTYCSKPILGTCEGLDVSANGRGEVRVSITPEAKPAKPAPKP